jgi:hypothetical protein
VEGLDLPEIISQRCHFKGSKDGFSSAMMVRLVMYAYWVGVPSSRQIEKKTHEVMAFRVREAGVSSGSLGEGESTERRLSAGLSA